MILVDVGTMGMYINLIPYGLKKLMEEYTKANREIHSLYMPTWAIKSRVEGGQTLMAYSLPYCPVERKKCSQWAQLLRVGITPTASIRWWRRPPGSPQHRCWKTNSIMIGARTNL